MNKTFLESREFSEWVKTYLTDDELAALQRSLLADPDAGSVIPGCGGLRKLRIGDPRRGQGKRGGARVIYVHVEEASLIYLVTVYGKDQKDDLSNEDKRAYRDLARLLKSHAQRSEEA